MSIFPDAPVALGHGPGMSRRHCGSKRVMGLFLDADCGILAPPHLSFVMPLFLG